LNQDQISSLSEILKNILANRELLEMWEARQHNFRTEILHNDFVMQKDIYQMSSPLEDPKLLTLDLWDTLIGRFRPAEAVKRSSSLYIALFYWSKSGFDTQRLTAREIHDLRLAIESDFVSKGAEPAIEEIFLALLNLRFSKVFKISDVAHFVDIEITSECANTYRIDSVYRAISQKDFEVVSDHFYNSEQLRQILNYHDIVPKKIHSSSQMGSSKRDQGKLFSDLGFDCSAGWVHIGDNPYSDVQNAASKGATTNWIDKKKILPWHGDEIDSQALIDSMPKFLRLTGFNELLCTVAQISYIITTFAIENACKYDKKKIIYLSREGESLFKSHLANQKLFDELPLKSLEPIYLPCSRASLFMASFSDSFSNIEKGLDAISLQYPLMSNLTFCSTLSLPFDLSQKISALNKLHQRSPLKIYKNLPPELANQVVSFLMDQRKIILEELSKLDITLENSLFCDLGWRGSMQDSIHRLLGDASDSVGVYLGVFEPKLKMKKQVKLGLLNTCLSYDQVETLLSFPGPLERIFTFNPQSTISYSRDESGALTPNLGLKEKIIEERTASFHSNYDSISMQVGQRMFALGIFGNESSEIAKKLIERIYSQPTFLEAATWFEEKHSEGFGAGDMVHYKIDKPSEKWFQPGMSKEIYKAILESRWHSGYEAWLSFNQTPSEGNHID
jgi:hypothetical protein